jgi:hypothetical protein
MSILKLEMLFFFEKENNIFGLLQLHDVYFLNPVGKSLLGFSRALPPKPLSSGGKKLELKVF